jgi:cystathionine beta-synthase
MLLRNLIQKTLAVTCLVGGAATASYHFSRASSSTTHAQQVDQQVDRVVFMVDKADDISLGRTPTAISTSKLAVKESVLDCIGETPLVRLRSLNSNPLATVYVKLESVNPSGSIKDRIAKHIVETFEASGRLAPGGVIVENSSGNTAAAVAMVAALKGYKAVLVVPAKCSDEKVAALKAFGARVVVCPPGVSSSSPHHYEAVAKRLEAEIDGAVRLDQYNNQLNVEAHYRSTGPEIWRQTGGRVDTFVCGASTGGTISGIGRFLKEASDGRVRVLVADPSRGSALLNRVQSGEFRAAPGSTQIEGIGKAYHVDCTHFDVIDDGIAVPDDAAFRTARLMAQREGILCGISSGANVYAALQLAEQATEPTVIVTVLPDSGSKYFSKLFDADFLGEHQLATDDELADMKTQYDVTELDSIINELN